MDRQPAESLRLFRARPRLALALSGPSASSDRRARPARPASPAGRLDAAIEPAAFWFDNPPY